MENECLTFPHSPKEHVPYLMQLKAAQVCSDYLSAVCVFTVCVSPRRSLYRLLQMSSLDIMWSSGKLTFRERPNGSSLLNIARFHFNLDCYSQLPGLIMNTNNKILIILLAWLMSDDTRISLTMPFKCSCFFFSLNFYLKQTLITRIPFWLALGPHQNLF